MNYKNIIEQLKMKDPRLIIVSGAQRSGTRITAKVLAYELKMEYVDEKQFRVSRKKLFNRFLQSKDKCIQAPAMLHLLTDLPDDIAVVIPQRDIESIVQSEKRINWIGNKKKERSNYPGINPDERISEYKYKFAEQIPHYKLDYYSLKTHPFWVNDRRGFRAGQTKKGEKMMWRLLKTILTIITFPIWLAMGIFSVIAMIVVILLSNDDFLDF